jgi:hypothetical protein
MIQIEVIGLDPPCEKCDELLRNVQAAVERTGVAAQVTKKWTLADTVRSRYGLLLSPALVIDGMVVAQGKVYKIDRIVELLQG